MPVITFLKLAFSSDPPIIKEDLHTHRIFCLHDHSGIFHYHSSHISNVSGTMQAEPPYLFFSADGTDRGSILRSLISSIS